MRDSTEFFGLQWKFQVKLKNNEREWEIEGKTRLLLSPYKPLLAIKNLFFNLNRIFHKLAHKTNAIRSKNDAYEHLLFLIIKKPFLLQYFAIRNSLWHFQSTYKSIKRTLMEIAWTRKVFFSKVNLVCKTRWCLWRTAKNRINSGSFFAVARTTTNLTKSMFALFINPSDFYSCATSRFSFSLRGCMWHVFCRKIYSHYM